jgi:ABC-type Zn uptake system ZnuABC Zn-binding protein ZnuA
MVGVTIAALVLLGLGFAGCTPTADPWKEAKAGQKHVLATFPPLYCLTHSIAGDDAYVLCFLTTEEPHEYTFSPQDAIKARGAHLIISNGLKLDDGFVDRLVARERVPSLSAEKALSEDMILTMGEDDDDHDKKDAKDGAKEGDHHHHGSHDPHVWLGPPQAIKVAEAIGKKLGEIDPAHADGYQKRSAGLQASLKKLQDEGLAQLKGKENRKVISMHDSMSYFAKAFGIEVVDTIQPLPGLDPDAARLAKLVTTCKEKDVRVITYEPQYSKSQPVLLQKQLKSKGLDVKLIEFDPLETAPLAKDSPNPDPGYYLQKMRENIEALAKALP